MNKSEVIKKLIDEAGYSKRGFAGKIGIPPTTLQSMLSRGIGNASIDNVIKVCKGLGITTDELEQMANDNNYKKEPDLTSLTEKDEKDIQKNLQEMIDDLNHKSSFAAFDGQILDEMDEEDRELLITSLEHSLRVAKRLAKQKFTPKKYKK